MKVLQDEDNPGYYGLVVSQKELDVITDIIGHTESKDKKDIIGEMFEILSNYRQNYRIDFENPCTTYTLKTKPRRDPCSDI